MNEDSEVNWIIAKHFRGATHFEVWKDFSPTTDWKEAGPLIEKNKIDIRYFNPIDNPSMSDPWMGGLTTKNKDGIEYFCTAYGSTPLIASMRALAKSVSNNK